MSNERNNQQPNVQVIPLRHILKAAIAEAIQKGDVRFAAEMTAVMTDPARQQQLDTWGIDLPILQPATAPAPVAPPAVAEANDETKKK